MNQLVEKILEEIQNQGAISFARFMERALYCPVYGYYEKEEDTLGVHGDFYTSVSVGPVFGELLALQFCAWLGELNSAPFRSAGLRRSGPANAAALDPEGASWSPGSAAGEKNRDANVAIAREPSSQRLCLVEAGAHRGDLARDILSWIRVHRPDLFPTLDYWVVEPSPRRQAWQRRNLGAFEPQVRWIKSLMELAQSVTGPGSEISRKGVRGVVFSNELLDSMPVHRFGWDAARASWFEWGVTVENGRFTWVRLAAADQSGECHGETPALSGVAGPWDWPAELLKALPDGFTVEVCPEASQWWAEAAGVLESGKLVALDYGLTAEEWVAPERTGGTLRAYRGHHLAADVLAEPGEQDITAHVNFTAIQHVGEAAGLKTEALFTQERFLTRIVAQVLGRESDFGAWTAGRTRQLQTLTHPNHLGRSFRVLVQSR